MLNYVSVYKLTSRYVYYYCDCSCQQLWLSLNAIELWFEVIEFDYNYDDN
jgi:hypothetical protein